MVTKYTIAFAFTLACILHASAGNSPVRCLGIEQGLSNNVITAIYQDMHGFMWIGTYDGLNRFDGYSFKIFRNIIGDTTSLSTNSIMSIDGDRQNNIWIGSQNSLNVFDSRTESFSYPRFVLHDRGHEQLLQGEVRTILCLPDGTTLAGSRQNGLIVFKDKDHSGMQTPMYSGTGLLWNYHVFMRH